MGFPREAGAERTRQPPPCADGSHLIRSNVHKIVALQSRSSRSGDPSHFPHLRITPAAETPSLMRYVRVSIPVMRPLLVFLPARRAIADYLNRDIPLQLCPDDVYLTLGSKQGRNCDSSSFPPWCQYFASSTRLPLL
ncbi:hypothetical protein GQ457_03G005680 [Hibiscus cannabinus]